jgi:hypothetical protein
MQLLIEALVVGIILLIISIPVMEVTKLFDIPYKYYAATIVIGMLTHFIFEAAGLNKWYCKYGNACSPHELEF